jgi:hypothetical protein
MTSFRSQDTKSTLHCHGTLSNAPTILRLSLETSHGDCGTWPFRTRSNEGMTCNRLKSQR